VSRHKKERREARQAESVELTPERSPEEMALLLAKRKAAILAGLTREAALRGVSMSLAYEMAERQH
jgi:hypothetical protein